RQALTEDHKKINMLSRQKKEKELFLQYFDEISELRLKQKALLQYDGQPDFPEKGLERFEKLQLQKIPLDTEIKGIQSDIEEKLRSQKELQKLKESKTNTSEMMALLNEHLTYQKL